MCNRNEETKEQKGDEKTDLRNTGGLAKFCDDDRDHLTADSGNGNDVRWRACGDAECPEKRHDRRGDQMEGAGVHTLRNARVPARLVPLNKRDFKRHSGEKDEKSLRFPG